MREDGSNAGFRRIGTLALWAIPLVLGMAASVWLGFWMSAHGFFNQLSQEQRRAIYVGAAEPPKAPLRVETPNEGCLKITRVDLDGSTAAVYFHSTCGSAKSSILLRWVLVAPDGTLLASDWQYATLIDGPASLRAGERGEAVFQEKWAGYGGIRLDKRAAAIRFEIEGR